MPDEQDHAEELDDDKAGLDQDEGPVIDVLDQTADADPGAAEAAAFIDEQETGSDLDGVAADPDNAADPFHDEVPAPEVAAMHVVDPDEVT